MTKKHHTDLLRAESLKMVSTVYDEFVMTFMGGSVDLTKRVAGTGYFNLQINEKKHYIPSRSTSSMDAELLVVNAALVVSCYIFERNPFARCV